MHAKEFIANIMKKQASFFYLSEVVVSLFSFEKPYCLLKGVLSLGERMWMPLDGAHEC